MTDMTTCTQGWRADLDSLLGATDAFSNGFNGFHLPLSVFSVSPEAEKWVGIIIVFGIARLLFLVGCAVSVLQNSTD